MNRLTVIRQISLALILSAVLYCAPSYGAVLTSTVDRNQLSINETITLSVNYDQQVDSSKLDLTLLAQDFEILGVSPRSSSSVSIVNGRSTRQAATVWTITIAPKRQGRLTIPALSIDNNSSRAITVQVSSSSEAGSNTQPLQVRVTADRDSVYPLQQLVVQVELSAQSDISDLNGPQLIVNGADVEVLGQQNFQRIENGVAKQIVILKYAVFAREAGELVIPVMSFTGVKGSRRSLFDSFGTRGQQVIARSRQLAIDVKPAVESNIAPWFPAEQVSLSSQWSGDISAVKVGEPITRTIKIIASAQRASIIPPLSGPITPTGYKSYKDQAQVENQTSDAGFTGVRIESEAIVASVEGEFTLPELKLSWWNVDQQAWQEAVLPAETLSATIPTGTSQPAAGLQAAPTGANSPGDQAITLLDNAWVWKFTAGLLAMVIALQFLVILKIRKRPALIDIDDAPASSEARAWSRLQKTLASGDAAAIRKDLIGWARISMSAKKYASLQTLADSSCDPQLAEQLSNLDMHLYKDQRKFDSGKLASCVRLLRRQLAEQDKKSRQKSKLLKPLYGESGD